MYKRYAILMMLLTFFIWINPTMGRGYVMPAGQLIRFMAANFSKLKTSVITQTIEKGRREDKGEVQVFKEKLWMKSPNLYHSRVLHGPLSGESHRDSIFRQLLISNKKERLQQILAGMGIDLKKVGFTRIEGIIAYRIGDKYHESPNILIEKERFIPLLLKYYSPGRAARGIITVQFRDYRKLEHGWYPFEILYSLEDGLYERYTIDDLEANVVIDPSLFAASGMEQQSERPHGPPEEEKLKRLIKTMEEKYGY